MTMVSGKRVNPLTATVEDIDPLDIGWALSRQCRYNGHVNGFLSVARHSLWVADHLRAQGRTVRLQRTGLLHDAAEAYLGDMIRPLKHGPLGDAYRVAEARLESVLAERFDTDDPLPAIVKDADTFVLMHRELPPGSGARWTWNTTPDQDANAWMMRFEELK